MTSTFETATATGFAPYVEPWTPGIGDPTLGGWLTVLAYCATAILCARQARARSRPERRVWWGLCGLLGALGLNKQLDLQSWFTVTAKGMALEQGWYEQRHTLQVWFVAGLAAFALGLCLVVARSVVHVGLKARLALMGAAILLAFVVIRAASFHHVDLLINAELFGLRLNWVLELGGIGVIAAAAWPQRARDRPSPRT